jgi:hypothetical protein
MKLDRLTAKAHSLAKLLQQDVGGLVLDVELAAQMERSFTSMSGVSAVSSASATI